MPLHNSGLVDLYTLNKHRVVNTYMGTGDRYGGVFEFGALRVIASADAGWDHVSVSRADRTPSWEEMDRMYRVFFKPGLHAYQLHVPESRHVNCHPYCLHLWRPNAVGAVIPVPPKEMV